MFAFELPARHQRRELNDFMIQARFKTARNCRDALLRCAIWGLAASASHGPPTTPRLAAIDSLALLDLLLPSLFLSIGSNACHVGRFSVFVLRSVTYEVSLSAT